MKSLGILTCISLLLFAGCNIEPDTDISALNHSTDSNLREVPVSAVDEVKEDVDELKFRKQVEEQLLNLEKDIETFSPFAPVKTMSNDAPWKRWSGGSRHRNTKLLPRPSFTAPADIRVPRVDIMSEVEGIRSKAEMELSTLLGRLRATHLEEDQNHFMGTLSRCSDFLGAAGAPTQDVSDFKKLWRSRLDETLAVQESDGFTDEEEDDEDSSFEDQQGDDLRHQGVSRVSGASFSEADQTFNFPDIYRIRKEFENAYSYDGRSLDGQLERLDRAEQSSEFFLMNPAKEISSDLNDLSVREEHVVSSGELRQGGGGHNGASVDVDTQHDGTNGAGTIVAGSENLEEERLARQVEEMERLLLQSGTQLSFIQIKQAIEAFANPKEEWYLTLLSKFVEEYTGKDASQFELEAKDLIRDKFSVGSVNATEAARIIQEAFNRLLAQARRELLKESALTKIHEIVQSMEIYDVSLKQVVEDQVYSSLGDEDVRKELGDEWDQLLGNDVIPIWNDDDEIFALCKRVAEKEFGSRFFLDKVALCFEIVVQKNFWGEYDAKLSFGLKVLGMFRQFIENDLNLKGIWEKCGRKLVGIREYRKLDIQISNGLNSDPIEASLDLLSRQLSLFGGLIAARAKPLSSLKEMRGLVDQVAFGRAVGESVEMIEGARLGRKWLRGEKDGVVDELFSRFRSQTNSGQECSAVGHFFSIRFKWFNKTRGSVPCPEADQQNTELVTKVWLNEFSKPEDIAAIIENDPVSGESLALERVVSLIEKGYQLGADCIPFFPSADSQRFLSQTVRRVSSYRRIVPNNIEKTTDGNSLGQLWLTLLTEHGSAVFDEVFFGPLSDQVFGAINTGVSAQRGSDYWLKTLNDVEERGRALISVLESVPGGEIHGLDRFREKFMQSRWLCSSLAIQKWSSPINPEFAPFCQSISREILDLEIPQSIISQHGLTRPTIALVIEQRLVKEASEINTRNENIYKQKKEEILKRSVSDKRVYMEIIRGIMREAQYLNQDKRVTLRAKLQPFLEASKSGSIKKMHDLGIDIEIFLLHEFLADRVSKDRILMKEILDQLPLMDLVKDTILTSLAPPMAHGQVNQWINSMKAHQKYQEGEDGEDESDNEFDDDASATSVVVAKGATMVESPNDDELIEQYRRLYPKFHSDPRYRKSEDRVVAIRSQLENLEEFRNLSEVRKIRLVDKIDRVILAGARNLFEQLMAEMLKDIANDRVLQIHGARFMEHNLNPPTHEKIQRLRQGRRGLFDAGRLIKGGSGHVFKRHIEVPQVDPIQLKRISTGGLSTLESISKAPIISIMTNLAQKRTQNDDDSETSFDDEED